MSSEDDDDSLDSPDRHAGSPPETSSESVAERRLEYESGLDRVQRRPGLPLTIQKSVHRPVVCQRCGCDYGYNVSAKANTVFNLNNSGTSAPPMMVPLFGANLMVAPDTELSKQSRKDAGYGALYDKLNKKVHLVACPRCRWYQPDMSREFGRRKTRWLGRCAMASLIFAAGAAFGALIWPVIVQILQDRRLLQPPWTHMQVALLSASVVVAIVGLFLRSTRKQLIGSFDLNARYPNHVAPYPDEPEAIPGQTSNPYIDAGVSDNDPGWYMARDGQEHGPYTWKQLWMMSIRGNIVASDHLLAPNSETWEEAGKLLGLCD